jgi:predicted nucleotidyltransferase
MAEGKGGGGEGRGMRLAAEQVNAIKAAAVAAFGNDVVVRLFGSRVDDALSGGDIDLHIEAAPENADVDHEIKFRAAVWKALDEEQIDVVVAARGQQRWIDRAAVREGVIL